MPRGKMLAVKLLVPIEKHVWKKDLPTLEFNFAHLLRLTFFRSNVTIMPNSGN
jgi:hypothetical protein